MDKFIFTNIIFACVAESQRELSDSILDRVQTVQISRANLDTTTLMKQGISPRYASSYSGPALPLPRPGVHPRFFALASSQGGFLQQGGFRSAKPLFAKRLVAAGADTTIKNNWGTTADGTAGRTTPVEFFRLCEQGQGQAAKTVLEELNAAGDPQTLNMFVNYRNYHGFSPLMYACMKKDLELVKALVAAGADVNAASEEGEQVLNWATRSRESLSLTDPEEQIIKLLVESGATYGPGYSCYPQRAEPYRSPRHQSA